MMLGSLGVREFDVLVVVRAQVCPVVIHINQGVSLAMASFVVADGPFKMTPHEMVHQLFMIVQNN